MEDETEDCAGSDEILDFEGIDGGVVCGPVVLSACS